MGDDMAATKKGIYHNLTESTYTVTNGEVVFYFSSQSYLKKFMIRYKQHRERFNNRVELKNQTIPLNFDTLADVLLYQELETRGFLVRIKRIRVSFNDIYKYAVRKMNDPHSPVWKVSGLDGKETTTKKECKKA